MYLKHFGLAALPFESTPDPAFVYLRDQYRATLAAMILAITSRKALAVVSGPVGSGKTTLGQTLMRYLPEGTAAFSVPQPGSDFGDILYRIAEEVGLENPPQARLKLIETLKTNLQSLIVHGGRLVIIIDEAQTLDAASLEGIRLLTNLETAKTKLVQMILLGQPELIDRLSQPEMTQLRQRVSVLRALEPLTEEQTAAYIGHRLKVAGGGVDLFNQSALKLIHAASGGIPRLINQICDGALLQAFLAKDEKVGAGMVIQGIEEMGLHLARPEPLILPSLDDEPDFGFDQPAFQSDWSEDAEQGRFGGRSDSGRVVSPDKVVLTDQETPPNRDQAETTDSRATDSQTMDSRPINSGASAPRTAAPSPERPASAAPIEPPFQDDDQQTAPSEALTVGPDDELEGEADSADGFGSDREDDFAPSFPAARKSSPEQKADRAKDDKDELLAAIAEPEPRRKISPWPLIMLLAAVLILGLTAWVYFTHLSSSPDSIFGWSRQPNSPVGRTVEPGRPEVVN